MQTIVGYLLAVFIFQPINLLVHEYGHAFFVKIFGGHISKIEIGTGSPIVNIGHLRINKVFFLSGFCGYVDDANFCDNRFKLSLIAMGGVIFNTLTIIFLILIKYSTAHFHFLDGYFFMATGLLILSALAPVKYSNGLDSDGLWLINIWANKSSNHNN